ncbi:MAG: PaaI family thioesterase [Halanaerobiales bacterium]
MQLRNDNMCFACGKDNPIGLKLNFELIEDNIVEAVFSPNKTHQGYGGIMHGGLVTTLLDEAMAKVLELNKIAAVTGEINVRFKKEVSIEQNLKIRGILNDSYKKKLFFTEAKLIGEDDELLATAEAKFMKVNLKEE